MKFSYVIITPAKNEEAYIEKTIISVISQSILPDKWVIVSDGSVDRTEEIVAKYVEQYGFIELVRSRSVKTRNSISKINAFNTGYNMVKNIDYQFIGNLDADVSFGPKYYEFILDQFNKNIKLGLAGGEIFEKYGNKKHKLMSSNWHVSGAIQLFRRKCFEDIGGYLPIIKGEDGVAVVMTRMKKWEVEKYQEIEVIHHRRVGNVEINILYSRYKYGIFERACGYHPIYVILKGIYRLKEKPYVISSISRLLGYLSALIFKQPFVIPSEVIKFIRIEQITRIREEIAKSVRIIYQLIYGI